MTNLLITGASGQVGNALLALANQFPDFHLVGTDRDELDITNAEALEAFFHQHSFDYCINCAAFTAVDKAEKEPEAAERVNVQGPRLLAKACQQNDCRLIHLSTDYVYHGNLNRPLKETDEVHPQSVYATTKLKGEQAARQECQKSCIIRTSWVYAREGRNFLNTMLRLGRERDALRVVFDQIGTPTYAPDLAEALLLMIQSTEKGIVPAEALQGIYHYSNEGVCSWYDFALAIFEMTGINCQVDPIESKDYPTPAARPAFSVLNKAKIKRTFGLTIRHWRAALREAISTADA